MSRPSIDALFEQTRQAVARNLRSARKRRGLTQEQAADRGELDRRHWQKLEAGECNLSLGTLARLAHALDVPAADLLQDGPPRRLSIL